MNLFNRLDTLINQGLSILIWVMSFSLTAVVFLRYGFELGATSLSELSAYLLVCICTLGLSQTYNQDRHVRLDIFYASLNALQQHWVNLLGNITLLMPFCLFLLVYCFDYVSRSWQLLEGSGEAAGLPGVYIIKSFLLIGPSILFARTLLQSIMLAKKIKLMRQTY